MSEPRRLDTSEPIQEALKGVAAELVLGKLWSEDIPGIAYDAMGRGLTSPSLALLAGATRADSPEDLRRRFRAALTELDILLPSRLQAAELLKHRLAHRVVSGALPPREGARAIIDVYDAVSRDVADRRFAGDGFGIAELVSAYYQFDDFPPGDVTTHRELERVILDECKRIAGLDRRASP